MLEFVDDIGREAERLNRITEKLLKLSRLDADKDININGTAVEVGTVIEKALGMLQPLAYNISVNLEYSKTGEHYFVKLFSIFKYQNTAKSFAVFFICRVFHILVL